MPGMSDDDFTCCKAVSAMRTSDRSGGTKLKKQ